MRFSVLKRAPDYDPSSAKRIMGVGVDGKMIVNCVEADEEQGYALALMTDPLDPKKFLMDPVDGTYTLARVTGKVSIVCREADPRQWDPNRKGEAKVQVGRDTNGDILVQVYSNARPGAIKQIRMNRQELPSGHNAIAQKAGACGGYAAELLADQFNDTIDPSAAASEAARQCAIMLRAEG